MLLQFNINYRFEGIQIEYDFFIALYIYYDKARLDLLIQQFGHSNYSCLYHSAVQFECDWSEGISYQFLWNMTNALLMFYYLQERKK